MKPASKSWLSQMRYKRWPLSTLNLGKFKGLITDIRLGNGQSGWEVAKHLRQANPTIPVVYMSGDSAIHWGAEGIPESVMITKPFFLPQIITALSTLLNQQPMNLGNSDLAG